MGWNADSFIPLMDWRQLRAALRTSLTGLAKLISNETVTARQQKGRKTFILFFYYLKKAHLLSLLHSITCKEAFKGKTFGLAIWMPFIFQVKVTTVVLLQVLPFFLRRQDCRGCCLCSGFVSQVAGLSGWSHSRSFSVVAHAWGNQLPTAFRQATSWFNSCKSH